MAILSVGRQFVRKPINTINDLTTGLSRLTLWKIVNEQIFVCGLATWERKRWREAYHSSTVSKQRHLSGADWHNYHEQIRYFICLHFLSGSYKHARNKCKHSLPSEFFFEDIRHKLLTRTACWGLWPNLSSKRILFAERLLQRFIGKRRPYFSTL